MLTGPVVLGVLEIFLRVDFDVATGCVDVRHSLACFDHFLEEEDLVRFFKEHRFAERFPGELFAAAVIVVLETLCPGRRKLGHADVFAVSFVDFNITVDAGNFAIRGCDFFGIGWRMVVAMLVTIAPGSVDDQRDVVLAGEQRFDGLWRKQDVGITADKRLVHQVFGIEERGQDVVVWPVIIVPKSQLGVALLDLVDLIAADEADVVDAAFTQCFERPFEDATPGDFGKAFGRVGGGWHKAAAAACADDDCSHGFGFPDV